MTAAVRSICIPEGKVRDIREALTEYLVNVGQLGVELNVLLNGLEGSFIGYELKYRPVESLIALGDLYALENLPVALDTERNVHTYEEIELLTRLELTVRADYER